MAQHNTNHDTDDCIGQLAFSLSLSPPDKKKTTMELVSVGIFLEWGGKESGAVVSCFVPNNIFMILFIKQQRQTRQQR